MARARSELQLMLEAIAAGPPVPVYFQPPESLKMSYPCIRYERDGSGNQQADDLPYRTAKRYQLTVIDRNPDSPLPDLVENLRFCEFDRWFAADNLNHWVFTLFF